MAAWPHCPRDARHNLFLLLGVRSKGDLYPKVLQAARSDAGSVASGSGNQEGQEAQELRVVMTEVTSSA